MITINLLYRDKTKVLEYIDWAIKNKPDECDREGYNIAMKKAVNFLLTGDREKQYMEAICSKFKLGNNYGREKDPLERRITRGSKQG